MGNLLLSVIIPTYNRKNILKKCLAAVLRQSCPSKDYEVIIVDDGSTDATGGLVDCMINQSPGLIRYFRQDNKGPAAARNLGIRQACGKIILFLGDDIIATPNLLEEHLKMHDKYPADNIAILGYVTWSPELKITPFMEWLETGGIQFAYGAFKDKTEVEWMHSYSSNLSVKNDFLSKNNIYFDEQFVHAAYEDSELGYRLKEKGMVLIYNKDALAYHYHFTSLKDACLRMEKVGESSQLLAKKIKDGRSAPEYAFLRRVLRKIKFSIYYMLAKFYERRLIKISVFSYLMSYSYNAGIEKYRKRFK